MATVLLEKDDHGRIAIRFEYNPELVTKIKKVKGRSSKKRCMKRILTGSKTVLLVSVSHMSVQLSGGKL
jgi:hypothetical protein